jgi:flagellar biosynthesis/type III secretory pathway M-ring protein FliF/YscJ
MSSDVVVNLVKQETSKVTNSLTMHLDTKFNQLTEHTNNEIAKLKESVKEDLQSNMRMQLIKMAVIGMFSFLLALIISRLMTLRQERNNPYYMDYKKAQQEVKKSKTLLKDAREIQEEKQKLAELDKRRQQNIPVKQPEQPAAPTITNG